MSQPLRPGSAGTVAATDPLPEADAAEQAREVVERDEGETTEDAAGSPTVVPLDTDPADLAEQQVEVPLDEDDYR